MRIDGRDRQVQRSRQAIRQPAYTSGVSRTRDGGANRGRPSLIDCQPWFDRQLEFHRCPAVGISCRPQLATMVLDDRMHDCEPHSRAFGSSGDLLRTHPSTVYNLARRGQIPGFRVGTDWRFRKDAIERWITKQTIYAQG